MTIFSRIRTESISKDLFNRFSENNTDLAWEYAFSHEIRRKNNAEADLDSVEYDIKYDDIPIEEMLSSDNEMLSFTIQCPFEFNLRMSAVIRACLNLSSLKLSQLIEAGAIDVNGRPLQKKHKIRNGDRVQVHKEKLKMIIHHDEAFVENISIE